MTYVCVCVISHEMTDINQHLKYSEETLLLNFN